MRLPTVALLVLLVLLPGCATTGRGDATAARVSVSVVLPDPAQGASSPDGMAAFSAIRGSIWGYPSRGDVLQVPVDGGKGFILDLDQWAAKYAPLAEPAAGPTLEAVTIEPDSVRFVRVGTFFANAKGTHYSGAGFRDPQTQDILVLVYFDRACSLHGQMGMGDRKSDIDVVVPGAGFYWLRSTGGEDAGVHRVTLATGISRVVLYGAGPH